MCVVSNNNTKNENSSCNLEEKKLHHIKFQLKTITNFYKPIILKQQN